MNLLKKPYGLTLQALLWVMIFGCLLAHPFTNATSSPPGDKREYVLIINSYNESSSWSWEIITDITARIEQIENLEVYVEHMNMLLMDQQSDLDNFRANLAREYGKNPPRMLIYIGAPAFTMRDFAEKEWGKGIPSIICAEEDFIGPDKYYVSKQAIPHSERIPLRKLNGEYNLTLLYAPIYLEQTIELMRLCERLNAVRDQLAARQRILHADVAHRDAVADADGRDEDGGAPCHLDACLDGVGDLIQIHVAGDNLTVGTHHTDEGAVQLFRGVAQGVKQASVGRALRAFGYIVTSHFILLMQKSAGTSSFSAKTDALGFNLSVCFADSSPTEGSLWRRDEALRYAKASPR